MRDRHLNVFRFALEFTPSSVMSSILVPTSLLFRFVLFKKHYEKYIQLSQKYEEARNMVYYLEEKYHEVKVSIYFNILS